MFSFIDKLLGTIFGQEEDDESAAEPLSEGPITRRPTIVENPPVTAAVQEKPVRGSTEVVKRRTTEVPHPVVSKNPVRGSVDTVNTVKSRPVDDSFILPSKSKPIQIPKQSSLKHSHFVSMGTTDVLDPALPRPIKQIPGGSVALEEIPFEATRNELVEIYLSLIEKGIKENNLSGVTYLDKAQHFLFLKTLAAAEIDNGNKIKLSELADSLGKSIADEDPSMWSTVSKYLRESEYPIIGWLKPLMARNNFMLDIINAYKVPLTHNQRAFVQKFKESTAFFFPDSVYMAWLAQSYAADSRFNPMYRESQATLYYHDTVTENLLLRTQQRTVNFTPPHFYKEGRGPVDSVYRFDLTRNKLLRIQGRTLLFLSDNNEYVAVKVQKKDEPKSSLTDEYQMADYLQKHKQRLELQSQLPRPLGQYQVSRAEILQKCAASSDYEKFVAMIGSAKDLEVYVYKAPVSYFTYLQDAQQNFSDFSASVKKNLHDLFVLLREGIVFPQLADMFHTHIEQDDRSDKGRYRALVQLLSILQFQMGRVDKWKKAVEFVNLRRSGIADLGDSAPLSSLLTVSEMTRHYFPELLTGGYHQTFVDKSTGSAKSLFTSKRRMFGNYLYLNMMAEYLLVIQLTIGSYGDSVTREMNTSDKHMMWKQLSELMFQSCAEAVTLMTGMPQGRALALIKQRARIDKHSAQTQFWMTPDYASLDESDIRMEQYSMYPGESSYEINDTLVEGVGLAIDGVNQDLGGYNQASPLKELEKLLYATVTLIEGTQQLDKQFLKQLKHTEDLIASSSKAGECYQAVAKLLDAARPGCEFQRRLVLSFYKTIKLKFPDIKNPAEVRFDTIEKQQAAITLFHFWSEAKKAHSNNNGPLQGSSVRGIVSASLIDDKDHSFGAVHPS